jgi:hypothetical protein
MLVQILKSVMSQTQVSCSNSICNAPLGSALLEGKRLILHDPLASEYKNKKISFHYISLKNV